MPPHGPLVIPVEKKGRFTEGYTLRFLCFDPETRMAYLSGKGTKVRFWKHQMKLYAVVPKPFERKDFTGTSTTSCRSVPIDFRREDFDANDLLTFVLHGVGYHKFDPDNADDLRVMETLPILLHISFEDSGTVTSTGESPDAPASRSTAHRTSDHFDPLPERSARWQEDASFFGKDRVSWQLRCPYYALWESFMTLTRDVLIADGLRVPVHGHLPGPRDPRNGLPLVTVPLWLQHPFRLLADAVVYTCLHARMVGCSPQGAIGVCMRHCYLCITDEDVLILSESGLVVRWMPLTRVERLEYSLTGGGAGLVGSDGGPAPQQTYFALLCRGGLADVLLMPCDAFTRGTASRSMAMTMPRMDAAAETARVRSVLETLATARAAASGPSAHPRAEAKADIDVGELDSSFVADLVQPSREVVGRTGDEGFTAVAIVPESTTLEQYCSRFALTHGRPFNWQPQPGAQQGTPSVLQSRVLAARRWVPQPERHPVALRPEFQMFYFPDGDPAMMGGSEGSGGDLQRARSGSHRGGVDEMYEQRAPAKRGSKLLNILAPELRLHLA